MTVTVNKEIYNKDGSKKLTTLNDFKNYGLTTDLFNFNIHLIDILTNKRVKTTLNNKETLIFNNLKAGRTYQLIEFPRGLQF